MVKLTERWEHASCSTPFLDLCKHLQFAGPMLALALWVAVGATPFPLPTVDGKPLAVTEGQTRFLVPVGFEKVRAFYEAQLNDPKIVSAVSRQKTGRVLTLTSKRASDTWQRAVIREASVGTEIEVTPVIRLGEEKIVGHGKPLVEFILGRSHDVDRAVDRMSDSHLEQIRQ